MSSNALLKGSLQTVILRLLSDKEQMYGYEITQKVREITGGEVCLTQGALYPALHKLEAGKLVESSTEIVEGRVRKYYRLTSLGTKQASTKAKELEQFMHQLQVLLKLKPAL